MSRHRNQQPMITQIIEPAWHVIQPDRWKGEISTQLIHQPLNQPWTLWFHEIDDPKWTKDSYQKIITFYNWGEFWAFYDHIPTWLNGMFFLMRESIFPQWEDEQNIRGGYWSYKVPKVVGNEAWVQLSAHCVGECATVQVTDMYYVNGITISPKINNCIIKILNRDATHSDVERLTSEIPYLTTSSVAFKAHLENRNEFVYE